MLFSFPKNYQILKKNLWQVICMKQNNVFRELFGEEVGGGGGGVEAKIK